MVRFIVLVTLKASHFHCRKTNARSLRENTLTFQNINIKFTIMPMIEIFLKNLLNSKNISIRMFSNLLQENYSKLISS